jgi:hypothetical protein
MSGKLISQMTPEERTRERSRRPSAALITRLADEVERLGGDQDLIAEARTAKTAGRPPAPRDVHGFKVADVDRARLWLEMKSFCKQRHCTAADMLKHFASDGRYTEAALRRLWKRREDGVRAVLANHPELNCRRNILPASESLIA